MERRIFCPKSAVFAGLTALRLARACILVLCAASLQPAAAQSGADSGGDAATALHQQAHALASALAHNPFHLPLVLNSGESGDRANGEVYALVDYPLDTVRTALQDPGHWCDILLLHHNTKYCRPQSSSSGVVLSVRVGKKTPEELPYTAHVEFDFQVASARPDYLDIRLQTADGPMGTSDYSIRLDAVKATDQQTFLHLRYGYTVGLVGRVLMQAYLQTAGRGKVGFSAVGTLDNGQPRLVGGVRGVVERNTVRYFFAVDAFLKHVGDSPDTQFDKRLQTWFNATERYPQQLHEMDWADYRSMKLAEYARQSK